MSEVYFVTDIEADGPLPGINSMISFASIALDSTGKILGEFEANLLPFPGAKQDKDTMDFWTKNPEAWKATQINQLDPKVAMEQYNAWICSFKKYGNPVFVGQPVCFDFMFIYFYLMFFGFGKPFSHSGLDVKTLGMVAMKCDYRNATKRNMPRKWFDPNQKHTHKAIDDAREQAYLFIEIYNVAMGIE